MSKKVCTVELAGQRYMLKFKTKAVSVIEEAFNKGLLQIIRDEDIASVRGATAILYAGRLWEKKRLPLGWSPESAEELIDEHEDAGGSWTDVTIAAGEALIRKVPQLAAKLDEMGDAAEAKDATEAKAAKKEVANPLSTEATGG